jgi:hypothetical protein
MSTRATTFARLTLGCALLGLALQPAAARAAAPVLTGGALTSVTFTEDLPAVVVHPGLGVADADQLLVSATVSLSQVPDGAAERLSADATGTAITAVYNAPILTLTGNDTPANYQKVLRSVAYHNSSQRPNLTPRLAVFLVRDATAPSAPASRRVLVVGVNDPPQPAADRFDFVGNTVLAVDQTATGPAVRLSRAGGGVLANDTDPDGDTLRVVGIAGCADLQAPFDCPLPGGAALQIDDQGRFTYTPAPGDSTVDTVVRVQIKDSAATVEAALTLSRRGRVWYVQNNAAGPSRGLSHQPFHTLAEAESASLAGETLYLFEGDGTAAGQNAGITLKTDQRLLGAGVALTVPEGMNGLPGPIELRAAAAAPSIEHPEGNAVTAGNGLPREIAGLRLQGDGGLALDLATETFGSGTVWIHHNEIRGDGSEGALLRAGGAGTLAALIEHNDMATAGPALRVYALAGRLDLTLRHNTLGSTSSYAAALQSRGGQLTLGDLSTNTFTGTAFVEDQVWAP